jgi:hypothetical protein
MGYFDGLTSSSSKTTPDGHRLFYPWGVLGRGYVIGSEREYERLRRQIKIYLIVGMAVTAGPTLFRAYLVAVVALAAWSAFYIAWTFQLLRGLQPSHERLSLRESMATQAREQSLVLLWILEIAAIGFVAGGVLILVFDPGKWLGATAGILFFGLCAACVACMLVMRRGT